MEKILSYIANPSICASNLFLENVFSNVKFVFCFVYSGTQWTKKMRRECSKDQNHYKISLFLPSFSSSLKLQSCTIAEEE